MKYFILTRCGHLIIKYKEFVSCTEQQRQESWLYINTICKCLFKIKESENQNHFFL